VPAAPRARAVLATAQERFEQSPAGQVAISVLVVVIVFAAIAWSSPDSAFRRDAVPLVEPVALGAGLDQAWFMFAPDPPRSLEEVEVQLLTASGEERTWTFPTGGPLDQLTWYRWHKLKEQAVRNADLRPGVLRWVASQVLEEQDYPAEVTMVLTTTALPPPGADDGIESRTTEVLDAETLDSPP
jgi:hypothetical protein